MGNIRIGIVIAASAALAAACGGGSSQEEALERALGTANKVLKNNGCTVMELTRAEVDGDAITYFGKLDSPALTEPGKAATFVQCAGGLDQVVKASKNTYKRVIVDYGNGKRDVN
ncbi:hypothetical protein [Actinomadura atramentaria]|uniref:hypothetical protein n=1 Tax=Actinomadura atramentaria TaxID=1990 RepID=UPI000379D587|nr:hypothetical protein [Actinomadura atramentaria]